MHLYSYLNNYREVYLPKHNIKKFKKNSEMQLHKAIL